MTTLSDLVQKTLRRLTPVQTDPSVVLANNLSAGAVSMTVSDPSGITLPNIQVGTVVSIDLEVFYVQNANGTTLTVVPGFSGSSEAAHVSGTLVYINPRFTAFDIVTAINDDLVDLSSPENGLYQVKALEFTYNPAISGYDMTDVNTSVPMTAVNQVLYVRYRLPYPIGKWVALPWGSWQLDQDADTTYFPSGYALTLFRDAYPGLPVRITYAAPFSSFVNLTDDATAVAGLTASMYPLPPLGAMMSLVAPREVKRNQIESEPDARRAPEVPPGAVMNSVAGIARERQMRINSESARLEQQYGGFVTSA